MRLINPKEFREQVAGYDLSCPFCTGKIEMFCAHGCPACGGAGRIDTQPRPDLEGMAVAFRRAVI